ncbi:MAG: hypothetical protein EPN38_01800 [Rhodanobacteraceae bacterium]|nr:MAG: hypothetical protein EPN38_01800 [Rhodanobacteraceae bacterium]
MKRSRLVLDALIVFGFWALVVGLMRWPTWGTFRVVLAYGLVVQAVGAALGLAATFGVRLLEFHFDQSAIVAGHQWQGARVSIGRLPGVVPGKAEETANV